MALICDNIECKSHAIPIAKYKLVQDGERWIVRCKGCGGELVPDQHHNIVEGVPAIGKFGMLSDADKKKMLTKRSDEDFKKNGEKYEQYVERMGRN